jgi:hypothetical protein
MSNHEAIADRDAYSKAMIRNDLNTCVDIEQRYGLYGYPPELVSVGLNAACEGKDSDQAIADYIDSSDRNTDQMPADDWSDES